MSETAAIATSVSASVPKSSRLPYIALALALLVLIAAIAVVGYPAVIILGIGGTALYFVSLILLTAADLFGRAK